MKTSPIIQKPLTRRDIISLAEDIIIEYVKEKGWNRVEDFKLDLQELYEYVIYPRYEYQLIQSEDLGYKENEKVLGKVISNDRVILIDRSISPPNFDARFTFTLGHEFGHGVLHPGSKEHFRCSSKDILGSAIIDEREVQANCFSEHLVMPNNLVLELIKLCYHPDKPFIYIGQGEYCFDVFGKNVLKKIGSYTEFCRMLAWPLTGFFSDISRLSLGLKIHKLGIISNRTQEKFSISNTRYGGTPKIGQVV